MNEQLEALIKCFNTIKHDELSLEMKQYASVHDVPIIQDEGLELMLQLLRIKQPRRILEIGSAIGYSSLMMARHLPHVEIVSIERDANRYREAVNYHERSNVKQRVTLIEADALEIQNKALHHETFDVIFIDAAKAQYQKFFEKYEPLLAEGGMIISDNLLFHGFVLKQQSEIESRNLRQLVRKIDHYNHWLAENEAYDTLLLPIGDGVAVSLKRTLK